MAAGAVHEHGTKRSHPGVAARHVDVAHKIGNWPGSLNDVGIVYHKERPFILSVLSADVPNYGVGVNQVAHLAFGEQSLRRELIPPGCRCVATLKHYGLPQQCYVGGLGLTHLLHHADTELQVAQALKHQAFSGV